VALRVICKKESNRIILQSLFKVFKGTTIFIIIFRINNKRELLLFLEYLLMLNTGG